MVGIEINHVIYFTQKIIFSGHHMRKLVILAKWWAYQIRHIFRTIFRLSFVSIKTMEIDCETCIMFSRIVSATPQSKLHLN